MHTHTHIYVYICYVFDIRKLNYIKMHSMIILFCSAFLIIWYNFLMISSLDQISIWGGGGGGGYLGGRGVP